MKEINVHNDNGSTYDAKAFFKSFGWTGVTFSTKTVTTKDDAKVALVTLHAKNPANGERIDLDLWPNKGQTEADLKAMPETLEDIIIRFGIYKDNETGEVYEADDPKVLGYVVNGKDIFWHGKRPEWDANLGRSVWSNEPAE